MRHAAIKEMYLNTEEQKPSLEEVLEFQGPRRDFTAEASPPPDTRAYMSAYEGGEVMHDFETKRVDDAEDQKDSRVWDFH